MKSVVVSALLLLAAPCAYAQTHAQYANTDGSQSPAAVAQCANGTDTQSHQCPGSASDPTAAQYTNSDGSLSPSVTLVCPGTSATQACNFSSGAPLGAAVANFNGLQFALAPGSLGAPGGTMAGYAAGDSITLSCTGVTFSISPTVTATAVSGGAVTNYTLVQSGVTTGAVPSGSISCAQASTSGLGTGFAATEVLGLVASAISVAALTTGGGGGNGSLALNFGDTPPANYSFGSENTLVGDKCGYGLLANATQNACLGHNALGNGGTGAAVINSVAVGTDAGRNVQGNAANGGIVLVGNGAGRNIAAARITCVGYAVCSNSNTNNAGSFSASNTTAFGYESAYTISSGAGNSCFGALTCANITTGSNNLVLSANSSSSTDSCDTANPSNDVFLCAGAGPLLSITGGGTPATSAATIAGSLNVVAGYAANGTAGVTSATCTAWTNGLCTHS